MGTATGRIKVIKGTYLVWGEGKKPINIRPQKVKTNLLGQTVKEA